MQLIGTGICGGVGENHQIFAELGHMHGKMKMMVDYFANCTMWIRLF
jgi:predicted NBD/HSP70 family sugar kinase